MNNTQNLREEWLNYLTLEIYYGSLNEAKRKDAELFADWWLSKFSTSLDELAETIEGKRKKGLETKERGDDEFESTLCEECGGYDECDCSGYNQAIDDFKEIIKSKQ